MNREYRGISERKYYFDNQVKYLRGDILGDNYEKVTIVMLSLNRSEHTLLLLKSLSLNCPDYAGKVLIADNGSERGEIERLKEGIRKFSYEIKLYEFGENFGVAKGRNKAFVLAETEWIFSLDNDIFFVENPFPKVEKTLFETGAKFCNLPLLDEKGKNYVTNGGHLWINKKDNNNVFISCGPIFMLERNIGNTEGTSVLSTYLFGGCAFYHRETFLNTGSFDENYFIGFEDIDYSLNLFKKGFKIANCCFACLVHNHPHKENVSLYDKERYRYDKIKKGAEYFFVKNGVRVWDEVTDSFFVEESLKQALVEDEKISLDIIYEEAKRNYCEVNLIPDSKKDDEALLLQRIGELEEYSSNQEKAIEELRNMNEELRRYSSDQEAVIANLKIQLSDWWSLSNYGI